MALDLPSSPIDNRDDLIDSRNVISRIEGMQEAVDAGETPDAAQSAELAALLALAEQGEGFSDWQHGVTLIRDTYFRDYMRDYFYDTAEPEAVDLVTKWPFNCIDWDRAANEQRPNFGDVDFNGVSYLIGA